MSGTGYYISQSLLSEGVHLDFIGPLSRQLNPINIGRHLFNRYILRNNDHPQRDTGFLKHYAKQVSQQLRELNVDIVFASGTLPVSYLDTDLPLVVWTDCTFANLLDYYPKYTNMSRRSIRDAHAAERAMYARADRMIFTSQWAADSAMSDYGLAPDRVEVISRAANIPEGRTEQDVLRMIEAKPKDRCILHFVGVDWERKGGDIAVEATRLLNERGIPTELRVVGAEPQIDGPMPDYVKPLGWISKSSPEGLKRFTELLSEAHFLIVPTRADAYGFAFLEASAFGVPSLAPRTGGVPMVMVDNVNGLLFDLEDSGAGYADAVERLYNNPNAYKELALSAFNDHLTRGNWRVVGKQLVRVLSEVLDSREAQDTRIKPDHPARSSEMDADPS
ncbi:MAG: glycosyltransferase family 4 protein [Phycisphaerales bacterium]